MKKIALLLILISVTASAFAQTAGNPTSKKQRVKDINGNYYITIKIGNQLWMAENLKVTKFRYGDEIPVVADNKEWGALATGGLCWYNNNSDKYKSSYGAMYNWYCVVDKRGLCPKGWHIPSDSEWEILISYLGGKSVAGSKVKESGTLHWVKPNAGATNESGFTALPSGDRHDDGSFYDLEWLGYFWASTEKDATTAWSIQLDWGSPVMSRQNNFKKDGFSIRCVSDK